MKGEGVSVPAAGSGVVDWSSAGHVPVIVESALSWESLEPMAARVAEFGWHVQLQLDGRTLPEREAMLKRLPGTLVIDHVGKFLEPVKTDHPGFRVLAGLVERGRTYVKLSAPYEVSKVGPPYYDDVGALARALVRAAPDRMVWATNWPHPTPGIVKPDDAVVLDMLLDWVPDEATRRKVLADNPADQLAIASGKVSISHLDYDWDLNGAK